MAGSFTTLNILDGGGTSRTMRVWDESGTGTGPYSFGQMLVSGTGSVKLSGTSGILIDSTQLAALATAYDVLNNAGGGQKIYTPTDQVVANKVQAQTSGATSTRILSVATTPAATSIKASAGNIIEIDVFNVAAYDVAVKFWNLATGSVTIGTTAPAWTIPLKAGTGYSRDFKYGKNFSTAITYSITKTIADSGADAVAAGDVTGTIDWI